MAEFETPEMGNLVSNERFQQKRQEAEIGMRPFPDEIRGGPIDFSVAKEALAAKPPESPTEIKINSGTESNFAELNDERFKLMTELEASFRKLEESLETKRAADLEKIRQANPELASFLEEQLNLGLIKEFRNIMKASIYRAATKDELEQIAAQSREFLNSISKVS